LKELKFVFIMKNLMLKNKLNNKPNFKRKTTFAFPLSAVGSLHHLSEWIYVGSLLFGSFIDL